MNEQEKALHDAALAHAKLHKKQRCAELADPRVYLPEENPVSVFMSGSPGAGKTEAAKAIIAELEWEGSRILRIDPDDLRSEFPGYTGSNSWLFQRAASMWVDKIHDLALENGQSFILDGTLSNLDRGRLNVERSLKRGRQVSLLYVYQSPHLAWEFVQAREAEEGRHVLPERFIEQYFGARDVVNTLKREFGAKIRVDLLFKPNDQSGKLVRIGVDEIDSHVPERHTREELEAALGIRRSEP
jgi:UDP-N-acetylglucosamine kinase